MSEALSIDNIRARHETLYDEVIESQASLAKKGDRRKEFLEKVDELLEDFGKASAGVTTFEDYRWLSDAIVKWKVVLSSLLNYPKTIRINPPPPKLLPAPTPGQSLTEGELGYWIEVHERYFESYRQVKEGKFSSFEEKVEDRQRARVFLASDIIDGKTNFVLRIAPRSYKRLEKEWMEELKLLRAYLLWLDRKGGIDPVSQEEDYNKVCAHLQYMLINPGIKAQPGQFGEVKSYLESNYLRHGEVELYSSQARELIEMKAYRLHMKTGQNDQIINWSKAETYVRMFYENIIPAVIDNDRESTRIVLKAMQSSGDADTYHIINCFEATLTTYFLNPLTVNALWDESKLSSEATSSVRTAVPVRSWPRDFVTPRVCEKEFEFSDREIAFKGVMSEPQRDALFASVPAVPQEHVTNIMDLYIKSRIIRKEATL